MKRLRNVKPDGYPSFLMLTTLLALFVPVMSFAADTASDADTYITLETIECTDGAETKEFFGSTCDDIPGWNTPGGGSLTDPSNFQAVAAGTTSINTSWQAASNHTGYELEQSPDGSANWVQIATPGEASLSQLVSSLQEETPYFFRLRSVDAQNVGNWLLANATTLGPSSGIVDAVLEIKTRQIGMSPETIMFSADNSTDSSNSDPDQKKVAYSELGYYFNFDDPTSGNFATTGNSKNVQASNAPRALHTFDCDGPSHPNWDANALDVGQGACVFNVGLRVANAGGDYEDASIAVYIQAPEVYYSQANTICVSSDSDFSDPRCTGATQLTDSPSTGSYSGKYVLFQNGSSGIYSPICIGYDEKNVTIETYDSGSRPVVSDIQVGVDSGCGDPIPSTATAQSYDMIAVDNNGYIIQGWAYSIHIQGLRVGSYSGGMASTLVTLHDIDADWNTDAATRGDFTGQIALAGNGQNCEENPGSLNCQYVHWPYGVFISEVVSIGENNPSGNLPLINFPCLANCGCVMCGIVGSEGKNAREHTHRSMGQYGSCYSNNWFRGGHIGGVGGKNRLTLRQIETGEQSSLSKDPELLAVTEDDAHLNAAGGWVRGAGAANHWTPKYISIVDNIFNDTAQNAAHASSSFLHIQDGYSYYTVANAVYLDDPVTDSNNAQIMMGGKHGFMFNTTWNGDNITCRYDDVHDGDANYQDQTAVFGDDPDSNKCNSNSAFPVINPSAPGS